MVAGTSAAASVAWSRSHSMSGRGTTGIRAWDWDWAWVWDGGPGIGLRLGPGLSLGWGLGYPPTRVQISFSDVDRESIRGGNCAPAEVRWPELHLHHRLDELRSVLHVVDAVHGRGSLDRVSVFING